MTEQLLLSVIITSYTTDRLKGIFELLDSLKKQTYRNFEIIFVAEHSAELMERVKSYSSEKEIVNVKVFFNSADSGASAARNCGIKQARGEIIAFIDDDAIAYPDWAEKIIDTYKDPSIIGVTGPAFPLWEGEPASWFPKEFYWILSCTSWIDGSTSTEVRNIWLQNGSFKREAFELAGVLDSRLGPNDSIEGFKGREFKYGIVSEEVEFSLRVRKATQKRIVYNPEVRINHRVDPRRLKLDYVARWSYWMGCSKHELKRLYSDNEGDILSQEHSLLGKIAFKLVPSMILGGFSHPIQTWHRLLITVTALSGVSAGYLAVFFLPRQKEYTAPNSRMSR